MQRPAPRRGAPLFSAQRTERPRAPANPVPASSGLVFAVYQTFAVNSQKRVPPVLLWLVHLVLHCSARHDDIFILRNNVLFYVKSNILRKRSNILRIFFVTMFTPEHSLLRRSTPLLPPAIPTGQPLDTARHPTVPTQPATRPAPPPYPASYPTRNAISPSPPPHPASLPSLTALQSSSATTTSLALLRHPRPPSKTVCGVQVNVQPPLIFYTTYLNFYVPLQNSTHPI